MQKLELHHLNNFPTVKRQLYDVLVSEFGDQAEFVIGNWEHPPVQPCLEDMRFEFQELVENEVRGLYLKALENFYLKREALNEIIKKMYGKIMLICGENLYDRLQRLPDFVEVRGETW